MKPAEITVTFAETGVKQVCANHTCVGALLPCMEDPATGLAYLGALVNNELLSLGYPLDVDSTIQFVTLATIPGRQIYVRSLSFLLAKAVKDTFPTAEFSVEHAIASGSYCEFALDGKPGITEEQLAELDAAMHRLVAEDRPIVRTRLAYDAAMNAFQDAGQRDKVSLLNFINTPKVVIYELGDFFDLSTGPMTLSTAPLKYFRLIPHESGFVMQMPAPECAPEIPPFKPINVLSETFKEYNRWGRILGLNTVGRLNEIIVAGQIHDFVKVAEALHEKKIARIADSIAERIARGQKLRWILISGPSSSGKTTFARRLAIQLRVNGLQPVTLGTDDYFVNREHTPLTDTGEYDFEHLEAVDLAELNRDLATLEAGEEIRLPKYDFKTGKRTYPGATMRIAENQIVLLEGIHSLNPKLTPALPADRKYMIYISALTQLNLDNNNRISTSDNRLIRRLVRDARDRGHPAARTLAMWPNVGRGERLWIFPFQDNADAVFNTALDYELAILSSYARPLLLQIKPAERTYAEARRILEFLDHFLPISDDIPPATSIIREFIGGSSFTD